jgi:TfoX/Sxy family transcriptional regulator of competence genes
VATQRQTVDAVLGALAPANVRARAMFGEYGVYCDDRFIGMICDDRFYVKVTGIPDSRLSSCERAAPYPGAKECFVISDADLADDEWLANVVMATASAMPPPKSRAGRATPASTSVPGSRIR